jgi:hypothetical protein
MFMIFPLFNEGYHHLGRQLRRCSNFLAGPAVLLRARRWSSTMKILLVANGESVKMVQGLMRHATVVAHSILYTHEAQQAAVQIFFIEGERGCEIKRIRDGTNERLIGAE